MNKEQLIAALNDIDEKYIIEADPQTPIKKEPNPYIRPFKRHLMPLTAVAACLVLCLSANILSPVPKSSVPATTAEPMQKPFEAPPSVGTMSAPVKDKSFTEFKTEAIPNPISSTDLESIQDAFNIDAISLPSEYSIKEDSIVKYSTMSMYELVLIKDDVEYTLRLSNSEVEKPDNLSGIYLSGTVTAAIYDSADINESPSMEVEYDNTKSIASGEWNGAYFSVSANVPKDIYKEACEIIKTFKPNL